MQALACMTADPRNSQTEAPGERTRFSQFSRPGSSSSAHTVMRAAFSARAGFSLPKADSGKLKAEIKSGLRPVMNSFWVPIKVGPWAGTMQRLQILSLVPVS